MLKRLATLNIVSTIVQGISTAFTYFILYKIIRDQIGLDYIGIWSLITSTSMICNILSLGIPTTVTRLVARQSKSTGKNIVSQVVFSSLFLTLVLYSVSGTLIYMIGLGPIEDVIHVQYTHLIRELFWLSLINTLLTALLAIFYATFDGLKKNYQHNLIAIFANLMFILLIFKFMSYWGINGVAWAQILQNCIAIILSFILLRNFLNWQNLNLFIYKKIFRILFHYGKKEQVISLSQIFFDPLVKYFLARFGGLSDVSYYEVANRIVSQSRGLLVSINQVFYVRLIEVSVGGGVNLYKDVHRRNSNIMHSLSRGWVAAVFTGSMILAKFVFEGIDLQYILFVTLITLGYFANLISVPAYYSNMALGKYDQNVLSNVLCAIVNISIGFMLGVLFDGLGVVIAWSIALIVQALFVTLWNQGALFDLHRRPEFGRYGSILLFGLLCILIVCLKIFIPMNDNYFISYLIFLSFFIGCYEITYIYKILKK